VSGAEDKRLAANRRIGRQVLIEMWGEGRLELADELYAPDWVDHVGRGPEPDVVRGPEGIKQAIRLFRAAFPDLRYTVEEEMAERDLVMARFSATGTHRGEFLGLGATGRRIGYTGTDVNRIRDGRIVESWVHYDSLGLLEQLGLVTPPPGT
jgi:predicted ester cyclase